MILKQYYLGCLAHASYLIADESTGTAAVVDPQRDIEQYVLEAKRLGVEIKHVLLTHFHADFVAGDRELQQTCGATIYVGAAAAPEYDCEKLEDGDVLEFGNVRIQALATPGHTPESMCYLVFDLAQDGANPQAVLTGDTLFIGDVGRPDLLGSVGIKPEDLASSLYDSLHDKLLRLPDATLVYPAHGAGSMCGKNLSTETVSTIGQQKLVNYALQPMPRADFIAMITQGQPQAPAYFLHDALMNRRPRTTLDEVIEGSLVPMTLEQALAAQEQGAQLVDVRDDNEVVGGTLQGAFHISLSGSFATWAGSLLALDQPVIVIAAPGREREAVTRMARIGLDRVVGFVDGFELELQRHPGLRQQTPQIDLDTLRDKLASDAPPLVLDVRTPTEWQNGHIDGALHVPLIELQDRVDEVPRDRELAVLCRTSNRSASAISILRRAGHDNVV
ncbi:MAG: MBL fold metallo-hydrolase, partial [Planctomycetes bacterium]|nr:MBL fold metallo-hydrolase [Planctomycetota bacterium]